MAVKLPTPAISITGTGEISEAQIESILQWYLKEIHGIEFTKAAWHRDTYGNIHRKYAFSMELKSQANETNVPKKAPPVELQKNGTIEID